MLSMRYVQAVTLLITLFVTSTSAANYVKIIWYADDNCAGGNQFEEFYRHAPSGALVCHPFGPDGTMSMQIKPSPSGVTTSFIMIYDTSDCTGTPFTDYDSNQCNGICMGTNGDPVGNFGKRFAVSLCNVGEPTHASKLAIRTTHSVGGGTSCALAKPGGSPTDFQEPDIVSLATKDTCYFAPWYAMGENAMFAYFKYISKPISGSAEPTYKELITKAYYSDAACTDLTWASPPVMDRGCITQRTGSGPDFTCASAPCGSTTSTTGKSMATSITFGMNAARTPVVNYVKFRFYQDKYCKSPTTYVADPAMAVSGRDTQNAHFNNNDGSQGQRIKGNFNTGTLRGPAGEQTYDGNALGQAMYLPVTENGVGSCTEVELGDHANTINSIKCQASNALTQCEMFASIDCTGSRVGDPIRRNRFQVTTTSGTFATNDVITGTDSGATGIIEHHESASSFVMRNVVGVFKLDETISTAASTGTYVQTYSECNSIIFAKVEDFKVGFEQIENSFSLLKFAAPGPTALSLLGRLAQECGGTPYLVQGILDTCQVNHDISKGHTWNAPNLKARCSLDWDDQFTAATRATDVASCQAQCYSDVDCLAIAWGRDGYDNNHKCVLCKDVTLAGHAEWDTYTKTVTPPFIKITTSTFDPSTYQTNYFATSDCTGEGLTAFNGINSAATCRSTNARSGGGRASGDVGLGSMLISSTAPSAMQITTVMSEGLRSSGDGAASDSLGCPNVVNYMYTEGLFTMTANAAAQQHRKCAVLFQGPPGTTLSFEFPSSTFALSTGACTAATADVPRECSCTSESVVIKDGLQPTSQQVGQPLCGTFDPQRILFSGNTARIDFEAIDRSSNFQVHVNHHSTKVSMHLPGNPTYSLGSDISIPWSIESSVGGWAECGTGDSGQSAQHGVGKKTSIDEQWQRRFECARSSHSDHGWIGIYRNGTCEDGANVPYAHATESMDGSETHQGFTSNAYASGQQPHECYLGYKSIPMKETRGTVIFKYTEDYQTAGWYSLRYFSGDSSGTVCEVIATSKATDPQHTKDQQCLYSPITRGQIYISSERAAYSGNTQRAQLPGFEGDFTSGHGNFN